LSKIEVSNSNFKITISVGILVALSFLLVIFFMNTYNSEIPNNKDAFFQQSFDPKEKRIFLIGSSQTAQINENFIQKHIFEIDSEYKIYNLGYGEDAPERRLQHVNKIILAKPEIIIYGLGFRDFAEATWKSNIIESENNNFFPEPEKYFLEFKKNVGLFFEFDFENFKYPRVIMKNLLHKIISSSEEYRTTEYGGTETKPFWPSFDYLGIKLTDDDLKELYDRQCLRNDRRCSTSYEPIDSSIENKNIIALKQMVKKFQENEIKVIIFSTPHNHYYLDSMHEADIQTFERLLSNITEEFDSEVYQLHKKYINENIWHDNSHIALGNEDIFVNLDIGEIILKELEE